MGFHIEFPPPSPFSLARTSRGQLIASVLLLLTVSFEIHGQVQLDVDLLPQGIEIGQYSIYVDHEHQYSLAQGLTPPPELFVNSAELAPSFGYTEAQIWVYLELSTTRALEAEELIIEEGYGNDFVEFARVELDSESHSGEFRLLGDPLLSGWAVPTRARPIQSAGAAFSLGPVHPGVPLPVLLRITNTSSLALELQVYNSRSFEAYQRQSMVGFGLVVGIGLAFIIINAFISLLLKSPGGIFFILFIVSVLLILLYSNGSASWILWPDLVHLTPWFYSLSITLALASNILFAWTFTRMREYSPSLFRLSSLFLALIAIIAFVMIFLPAGGVYQLTSWLMIVGIVFNISSIIILWVKHAPFARVILFSWIMLFSSGLLPILANYGILPNGYFTRNAIFVGYFAYCLILSFALLQMHRRLQHTLETRTSELVSLKENLELQVLERSAQLETV